jgi:hypothetical protein
MTRLWSGSRSSVAIAPEADARHALGPVAAEIESDAMVVVKTNRTLLLQGEKYKIEMMKAGSARPQ